MKFESFYLRFSLSMLCILTYSYKYLPHKIKACYFAFYWHFMVMMVLPFQCTFLLFMNDFHPSYLYWEIFCVVTTIIYIPNWFAASVNFFIAVVLATIAYYVMSPSPDLIKAVNGFDYAGYMVVLSFTTFASMAFIHANRATWLEKQQKQLTALAGSVAHELRNPLNAINAAQSQITLLSESVSQAKVLNEFKEKIINLSHIISESVIQANDIINLTLSDVTKNKIASNNFVDMDARSSIDEVIEKFGYNNLLEKERIRIRIYSANSFVFRANSWAF